MTNRILLAIVGGIKYDSLSVCKKYAVINLFVVTDPVTDLQKSELTGLSETLAE